MSAIDLYWLPLGAGGRFVRLNGLAFEAMAAHFQHRGRADLYHSASGSRSRGPVRDRAGSGLGMSGERGVVAEGPVGIRAAGRLRLFRYSFAAGVTASSPMLRGSRGPQRLSDATDCARHLLSSFPRRRRPWVGTS
jgi:hypothetical protein